MTARRHNSIGFRNPVEAFLRKRSMAPKHRTYFEHDQKMQQHVNTLEWAKQIINGQADKAVQFHVAHWEFIQNFVNYPHQILTILNQILSLSQPYKEGIHFKQDQEPKCLETSFKLQTNKMSKTTLFYRLQSRMSSQVSLKKVDFKQYKKAYDRQKENNINNALHLLHKQFRNFFDEPESLQVSRLRDSFVHKQSTKKHKVHKMQKNSSKSFDMLPIINRSIKGAVNTNQQFQDFAFDSNGSLIELRKKGNNKLEKEEPLLQTTTAASSLHQVARFTEPSKQFLKRESLRRSHFDFRNQSLPAEATNLKQSLLLSTKIKAGINLNPKAEPSQKLQKRGSGIKLPRI